MDWANEKYVRLFVRDTITWKMLPWQSRALLPLILRKLDRAGVLDLGEYGDAGVATMVDVPLEFVQAGLPALLKQEVFVLRNGQLLMPKYIPAQETRQSDAQRKRDSREKRATGCDEPSPAVTSGHQESHEVTPTPVLPQSYPQAETEPDPSRAHARSNPPANEPGKPTAYNVVSKYLALRSEIVVGNVAGASKGGLYTQPQATDVEKASTWLSSMSPEDCADLEPAMRLACEHVRDGTPGWSKPEMAKVGYLFGSIVRSWPDLREEIHGCAPTLAQPKAKAGAAGESTRIREW